MGNARPYIHWHALALAIQLGVYNYTARGETDRQGDMTKVKELFGRPERTVFITIDDRWSKNEQLLLIETGGLL